MQEWKSELFQATSPYSMQLSSYYWTPIYWPSNVEDLESYDSDVFSYDPRKQPDRVTILKTGLYKVSYKVPSETIYSRNNYMEVVVEAGKGSKGEELERTRTFQSIYRTGTTNTLTEKVYVNTVGTWVMLKIKPQDSRYTTAVYGDRATLTIERIKPI